MSESATWRIRAVLLLLLLSLALPDPCSTRSVNPRRRREVVKRAKPPGGHDDDGGRPITGLQAVTVQSDDTGVRANGTAARPNRRRRPRLLDIGSLFRYVMSPYGNATDRRRGASNKSEEPVRSRHIDASMAEVVAVQTFDGDVVWIEAKFVNQSHGASHARHRRTRPYSVEERLTLVIPVVAFLMPFLVWLSCMVICIVKATVKEPY